jgi:TolA-binding protein
MSPRLKKILFASLLIVTVVLAFSAWLLQKQMVDAQTQTNEAQSQLTNNQNLADQTMYYGNLSESLQSQLNSSQTQISNLQNLTDKLQNQINNLQTQLNNSQAPAYNVTVTAITWGSWTNQLGSFCEDV